MGSNPCHASCKSLVLYTRLLPSFAHEFLQLFCSIHCVPIGVDSLRASVMRFCGSFLPGYDFQVGKSCCPPSSQSAYVSCLFLVRCRGCARRVTCRQLW